MEYESEIGAERALLELKDTYLDNRKIMVRKVGAACDVVDVVVDEVV